MLVEISGKVLNLEHPLRFSFQRDLRLIPVGIVSRFKQFSISNFSSWRRFWNEEGSSTKLGISDRYNCLIDGAIIPLRKISGWTKYKNHVSKSSSVNNPYISGFFFFFCDWSKLSLFIYLKCLEIKSKYKTTKR